LNSIRFEINFEQSPEYVYIQTDGEASVRGFDELLTAIVESPNWITGAKQLVDHTKLNPDMLTSEDVRKIKNIVKKHAKKLGNGRCAFVVFEAAAFGLVRMYELYGGYEIHQEVAVFYTIDDAVEWLRD
jgi:hypothetical protein